jgi:hypothetical protein
MSEYEKHFSARLMVEYKNGNANASDVHTIHTKDGFLVTTWENITKKHKLSEIKEVRIDFH